jgi:hypothetical protein
MPVEYLCMPTLPGNGPMRDVLAYPSHMLRVEQTRVIVAARYRRVWDDGFGARGWKLECALDDPWIIASTRETGDAIPTSVFVHDILDHLLSGFAPSDHRAEAMALVQLGERTGSDINPDFEQLAREDLLAGRVNGEPLAHFLGPELMSMAGSHPRDPRAAIDDLHRHLGERELLRRIVARFRTRGVAGWSHAQRSWARLGLPFTGRARLGLILQQLLVQADSHAESASLVQAGARITVTPGECTLELRTPGTAVRFFSAR